VKKRFILFMLLPAISLTANTNSFYERVYALQNHNKNSYSNEYRESQQREIQHRNSVVQNTPKKVYRYRNSRVEQRHSMVVNRPIVRKKLSPSVRNISRVKVSSVDSKKFFFATRAAKSGNAKAQFDLAIMYATGRGVQKNEKIAFNWFHKSARKNYAAAKHYMGISFLQGRGVRKQTELARYWFRLASKQGYSASRSYLAKIDGSRG